MIIERERHIAWLRSLEKVIVLAGTACCFHGCVEGAQSYFLETLEQGRMGLKPLPLLAKQVSGREQRLFLCGHSHRASAVGVAGKFIVNPGCVSFTAAGSRTQAFQAGVRGVGLHFLAAERMAPSFYPYRSKKNTAQLWRIVQISIIIYISKQESKGVIGPACGLAQPASFYR